MLQDDDRFHIVWLMQVESGEELQNEGGSAEKQDDQETDEERAKRPKKPIGDVSIILLHV